jgi:C4-dicarboxylate-binding protein DctP
MKKMIGTLCACAALLAGGTATAEDQPLVIRFSHVTSPDSPKGKGALHFKELAETRSGGRIKVEVYPNSQYFKDRDEFEALKANMVQMLAPSLSKFAAEGIDDFEVFDLPFAFDSIRQVHELLGGPIGQRILQRMETHGLKGLAFWDNGFKQISANFPIIRTQDLYGKRIRIQPSRVLRSQFVAVGALPVAMAFSATYDALKSGEVDAGENTTSNLLTQRHHEVQSYITLSNHGYLGYAVIANKAFWDGLPTDTRALLTTALADASRYVNAIAERENDEALARIEAARTSRIVRLSAEERNEWKRAMAKSRVRMDSPIAREVIEMLDAGKSAQP